jgi:hypothetical protein
LRPYSDLTTAVVDWAVVEIAVVAAQGTVEAVEAAAEA